MRARTLIIRYVLGLLVVAAMAALWSVLDATHSGLAWIAFLPVLLVLWVLGEWAFQPFMTPETGHALSSVRFSVRRIGIALLLMLPIFLVAVAVALVAKAAM